MRFIWAAIVLTVEVFAGKKINRTDANTEMVIIYKWAVKAIWISSLGNL